ncbi:diacylglycerol kinase [Bacillus amyloliquefaciens]|uniref:dihydrofolate reductase family protein n=1 Tax=Bacillus amyloliquefaciens TaxID=1390 RepID=UPI000F630DA6|nr:dihydrofolate reductase family protein [Bacillus amyloliquefaciens]QBG57914.1 diacylglycerol kinase [Bacillus amyloliquefaciens]
MSGHRKLVFYGAVSTDGYLARENHSLDWLIGTEGEEDTDYADFYESVDTIIMGRKTYEEILVLFPDEFPYKGKECYVFSRTLTGRTEDVRFIQEEPADFIQALKRQDGKRIWIVGGGDLLQPILKEELVDEFIIQIAPVLLGRGIPLFRPGETETALKLTDVRRYKQFAELRYEVR